MRRNARRRSRSTVLGAVISLIVVNAALAWRVNSQPGLRDPVFERPADDYKKRIEAAEGKPRTVVFLGSSRTGNGVRPDVAQQEIEAEQLGPCLAHNLHAPRNGPLGQLLHWRRLLDRGLRPDVVVLEITIPGFAESGAKEDAGAFGADRMSWDEVQLVQHYGYRDSIERDWWEVNLNPWSGFRFQMMGTWRPTWLPFTARWHEPKSSADLGWKAPRFVTHDPATYPGSLEQTRGLIQFRMEKARFNGPEADAFREIVRSCREHRTVPAVFVTPEGSAVRAWTPAVVEKNLQAFLKELGTTAVVADGRSWLPDEAFSDGHHAVRAWSGEYTRHLTKAVVIPALRKQEQAEAKVARNTR